MPVVVDLITPPASPVRGAPAPVQPVESRKRPAEAEPIQRPDDEDDEDDACVEVAAPQAAPTPQDEAADDGDEIVFCGRTGSIALSDFPHARFDCCVHPWSLGAATNMQHCQMCYCYVCDSAAADCSAWRSHSQASGTVPHWRALREAAKRQRDASPAPATTAVPAEATRATMTALASRNCTMTEPSIVTEGRIESSVEALLRAESWDELTVKVVMRKLEQGEELAGGTLKPHKKLVKEAVDAMMKKIMTEREAQLSAEAAAPTAVAPAAAMRATAARQFTPAAIAYLNPVQTQQAMETVRRATVTATARSISDRPTAPSATESSVATAPAPLAAARQPSVPELLHAYRCRDPSCRAPNCAATKLLLKRVEAHARVCPVRAAALASSGGSAQLSPAGTAMRLECKVCRIFQLLQSRCGGGSSPSVVPLPSTPSSAGGVDAAALVVRLRGEASLTLHEKNILTEIGRLYTTKAIPKDVFYQRVKSLVGLPKLKEAITSLAAAATPATAGAPAATFPSPQQPPLPRAAPAFAFRVNVQAATSACCGRRAPVSSPSFVSASRQQTVQVARTSPTTWRPGARLRLRIRVDRAAGLAWPIEEVEC